MPALWAQGDSAVLIWPDGAEPPNAIGTLASNTPAVTADTGGDVQLTGGEIDTFATGAAGTLAGAGGSIELTGTTIVTHIDDSPGLAVNGAGGSLTAIGAIVKTDGVAAFGAYNGSGSGFSTGGTMNLTNTTILTTGSGATGVVANSGGVTTFTGGAITTQGDNALGLYASGVGSSITATGATINTSGFEANGVASADGGATNVSGGSINTAGNGAYAVVAESGGLVRLSGTTIGTTGDGSGGFGINGAGSEIDAANLSITTTGGYDSVSGLHSYGVYNGPFGTFTSGGVANLTDTSVSTQGVDMHAVFTNTGGSTTILGGSFMTAGSGAHAIFSENGGTTIVGVSAIGPTTLATTGTSAAGVVAYSGGAVQLTGATVTTSGDGSTGLAVNGSSSSLTASGVSVKTSGGVDSTTGDHADGAYNGPYLPGGLTSGGMLSLTNSTIATGGAGANGVSTSAGGTTAVSGGSIATTGLEAEGVIAEGGGAITLSGTSVATSGDASKGLDVTGTGSSLTASNLKVTTSGTINAADGDHAFAVYNGFSAGTPYTTGGTATLTNVTVQTSGATSSGVVTESGGVTNLNGVSVATSGQDAHAVFVSGSGSKTNLSGSGSFTTTGAGAIGLYATRGGVVNATSPATTTISTAGGVSPATGLGAYGVNADGAGSAINLASATITTSGAGAAALYASDVASTGSAGTITVSGTLTVNTTNASTAAAMLEGAGASVLVTGGGTITSAGDAIEFTNASNAVATFDNFTINNLSGNLVFADPSTATINFNNTTANAGLNNLLDATNGSDITLNTNASTLTGAIKTDPTSTTNVNLVNGTKWTMTGSSVISNLAVTNSVVVFAPPSSGVGFKTLTVNNYTGSGANITMNVALGTLGTPSDQIVINGGKATGSTLLTINNLGPGGLTTGLGIPLVVAVNGGTTSSNAFSLASPFVDGYRLSLQESGQDWYLVSAPTSSLSDVQNSVNSVAKAVQQQIVTGRVLQSILLGATEQISCSNCSSGFGSIGSYALGAHGRWDLTDEVTLMGGFSYDEYTASGITVTNAPTFAGSLVYDPVNLGHSRPFVEVGGGVVPYEQVSYSRSYVNSLTPAVGQGTGVDRSLGLFGRVGWVDRLTPIDEAAVYTDISRSWLSAGGYTEAASSVNPFPATVQTGIDTLNVARLGGQYTHLFNGLFEVNVSAAVAYGFDAGIGSQWDIAGFGPVAPYPIGNSVWYEWGGRVGYRVAKRMVVDAFLLGTVGGQVGTTFHGGLGLRYLF